MICTILTFTQCHGIIGRAGELRGDGVDTDLPKPMKVFALVLLIGAICWSLLDSGNAGTIFLVAFCLFFGSLLLRWTVVVETSMERIEKVISRLKELDVIREKVAKSKTSLLGWPNPNDIEAGSDIGELVKPFCHHALSAAYECSLGIDQKQIAKCFDLNVEEQRSIEEWEAIPYWISWQRWTGGYERWAVQLVHRGTGYISQQEFNCLPGVDGVPGQVWKGMVGSDETTSLSPIMELVILRKEIRFGLKFGRFGADYNNSIELAESVRHQLGTSDIPPKAKWLVFRIPLEEERLDQYQQKERSYFWDYASGRPLQEYYNLDEKSGCGWLLRYSRDLRPHIYGTIESVDKEEVVFSCLGRNGKRIITKRMTVLPTVVQGQCVYAVFNESGEIDHFWSDTKLNEKEDADEGLNHSE